MRYLAAIIIAGVALGVASPARADYYCRTAPVGESTRYCASEAFVTKSTGHLAVLAFAGLPACNSASKGSTVFISDSNVSTFNANITAGGGSNAGLALCNGSNWTFH